jgi:hypothetical protein
MAVPLQATYQDLLPRARSGDLRSIGGTLGIAVLGSILSNGFSTALPADVSSEISPSALESLAEAQLNMTLEMVLARFGLNTDAVTSAVSQAAKTALSASLRGVFEIAAALVLCATVLALFLREIPLRKTNRREVDLNDEKLCEA